MPSSSVEWFDVVDREDRIVGRCTREEVHRRGLLHRAVHVFVYRPEGDVFLQKRSATKDTAPNRWVSSCSGHVDQGENYLGAAVRELGEEIGISVDPRRLVEVGRVPAVSETGWEFVRVYRLDDWEEGLTLDPVEIQEGRWLPPQDVDAWLRQDPGIFSMSFRYLWARLRPRFR